MPILTRTAPRRLKRTKNPAINQPQPATPIYITNAQAAGSKLMLTFDQAVMLDGTPGITVNVAKPTPVSAVQTGPNAVTITFSGAIAGASAVNIPFRDPAIRNAAGGYVTARTFVLV